MANLVWDALADRVRRLPTDPVITYVGSDGTRAELSARTLANNVAKAAGALRDEAMLEPGHRIDLRLPWHWQRSVWTLAAWCVGACVVEGAEAPLHLLGPADAAAADGQSWAVSLHPFGLPLADLPDGMEDAATLARLQPDDFWAEDVAPGLPAWSDADGVLSTADAWRAAQVLARDAGVLPGERIACAPKADRDGSLWCTLVPLAADASIVLVSDSVDARAVAAAESARLA